MSTHELEKKCAEYERVIQKLHHRIQTGWCPARVIIGMWRTYRARVGFLEMKYAAILISKTVRGHFARTNEYLLKRKDHHARLIHAAENLHKLTIQKRDHYQHEIVLQNHLLKVILDAVAKEPDERNVRSFISLIIF
jgi:hypothetical protein